MSKHYNVLSERRLLAEQPFRFKAETMPNGKSYPAKLVFEIDAIMDEMQLRNGCPWKGNEEAELREDLLQQLTPIWHGR